MPLGAVQVKEDYKLDSGKTQTFSVTCDDAKGLVLSGGYSISGNVDLISNQPSKNGWQVTMSNQSKARQSISVYANCLVGFNGKVQTTHIEQKIEGKGVANLKLGCQIAGKVVGGGYDLADSANLLVTESRLVGTEWAITIVNQGRNKQTFDAYAQCLSGATLPSLSIRNDSVKIPAGKSQKVEIDCGIFPISGAYQLPLGLAMISSQPVSDGWIFEVRNNTRQELIFSPQAVCTGPSIQMNQRGR